METYDVDFRVLVQDFVAKVVQCNRYFLDSTSSSIRAPRVPYEFADCTYFAEENIN